MNILGVDYGEKRIGLAWMDTGLDVVLPFGVIVNESESGARAKLSDLVKKEKIDKVVFGLPFNLDGTENKHTKQIRNFAEQFQNHIDAEIGYVNEMFSSQQADQMGAGVSRDEKAAMVILESYKNKK